MLQILAQKKCQSENNLHKILTVGKRWSGSAWYVLPQQWNTSERGLGYRRSPLKCVKPILMMVLPSPRSHFMICFTLAQLYLLVPCWCVYIFFFTMYIDTSYAYMHGYLYCFMSCQSFVY